MHIIISQASLRLIVKDTKELAVQHHEAMGKTDPAAKDPSTGFDKALGKLNGASKGVYNKYISWELDGENAVLTLDEGPIVSMIFSQIEMFKVAIKTVVMFKETGLLDRFSASFKRMERDSKAFFTSDKARQEAADKAAAEKATSTWESI